MTILVIDDDPLAAEMTIAILQAHGHQTLHAENALDGLEQLAAHADIRLVVSDLHMPLMSGLELFHELREQGNMIPFVLLSGDSTTSLIQSEPALDGCLTKDFDLVERLPQLVHSLLPG